MSTQVTENTGSCERKCGCTNSHGAPQLVVLTGGPGAGKTAVLEMAKKILCNHIAVLPEAASIVFGGGFWRLPSETARTAAQKAIFHVQFEMENLFLGEKRWSIGLCDRGTLDGLAYWPGSDESFIGLLGHSLQQEYSRYKSVIHLKSPSLEQGYNHKNTLRIESPAEAEEIDHRIQKIWSKHPNYLLINSSAHFLEKAHAALAAIVKALPSDCACSSKIINN